MSDVTYCFFFFFQAEDGIRDVAVTGVQTCALPIFTAIRQDDDNPAVRASETLMALLYPDGHPYGRRTKGSVEIIESLTRPQLLRLHADRFAPTELTAVVVGDAEPARVQDVAARVFGGWRKPVPAPI